MNADDIEAVLVHRIGKASDALASALSARVVAHAAQKTGNFHVDETRVRLQAAVAEAQAALDWWDEHGRSV